MNKTIDFHSISFSPTLCVTHKCNLSCVYCYQENKNSSHMNFETAKRCIDDIFSRIPEGTKVIEISFIGGEPLLEFELLRDVFEYTTDSYPDDRVSFFATTNGTTLSEDEKEWFSKNKKKFVLGLSLDGTEKTHNNNRSNSYSQIDIPFFINNWPKQGPKMTISEYSLHNLAENIISIHEQGFEYINGVNFAEGNFNWDSDDNLRCLASQLDILLEYYTNHIDKHLDQMFAKHIEFCSSNNIERNKPCGIGTRTVFYDVDGERYPCSFVTPLTFSKEELDIIRCTDFSNNDNFMDKKCREDCYIYPICNSCSGANFLVNHAFNRRIKTRCRLNKIVALYIAELHARRILNHLELYPDSDQLYFLIEAIKGIKANYLAEFSNYIGHN